MTFINHLATLLELLKVSHPKYFMLIQTLIFGVFFVLQTHPELALQYIPQKAIDTIIFVLVGLGFSVSSSTTNYLSPNHQKVLEIEQKNSGELDPQKYKV